MHLLINENNLPLCKINPFVILQPTGGFYNPPRYHFFAPSLPEGCVVNSSVYPTMLHVLRIPGKNDTPATELASLLPTKQRQMGKYIKQTTVSL